ncbi:LPXTG cell wall anchor domain-containing protein [Cellulomonas wangsupingiae]|uniref:LPXTG cell wall anchor domain-containing protein n=1 Tax=Cellulomonas wangsupingiae TaxID=2968085 RepID=UPI0024E0426C|nr:LPXTG cell wall anchor domain-containing protein [Cellulomonas wangsupingiae]
MNRRLPIVLMSVAALVVLPATTAAAGGGQHGSGKPGYSSGPDKGRPDKGKPTTSPADLCGGKRHGDPIAWEAYTCEKATGYFLYKKKDVSKPAGWSNSRTQHRVALHEVWAWPTDDASARREASPRLPKNAQVIPLTLDAKDTADVCAAPGAYGLQVDLVGNGVAGRKLDLLASVPTVITPPDGGFSADTLAYYGHYDVTKLVDIDALCDAGEVVPPPVTTPPVTPTPTPSASPSPSAIPTPAPSPSPSETSDVLPAPVETPAPSPTPTPSPSPSETSDVLPAPVETPVPSPSPSETSEVLPAPAETPTPSATPTPAPTPTATERSEVLSAVEDDDTLAATGTQAAVGLLAAIAAIAGGAALLLVRRRRHAAS